MTNECTVGDDYINTCPNCHRKINIGHITRSDKLHPGFTDTCGGCGKEFQIDKIEYIPNVWLRKHG